MELGKLPRRGKAQLLFNVSLLVVAAHFAHTVFAYVGIYVALLERRKGKVGGA
jgi:hypothetical protein